MECQLYYNGENTYEFFLPMYMYIVYVCMCACMFSVILYSSQIFTPTFDFQHIFS